MKKPARKPRKPRPVSEYFEPATGPEHAGDRWLSDLDAVYLSFTGDRIFRFCISKATIGQQAANYIAGELAKVLNDWAEARNK